MIILFCVFVLRFANFWKVAYATLTIGMLDREMYSGLRLIRTEKLALKLGSSKQGNAIRALVGSKWVKAKVLKQNQQVVLDCYCNVVWTCMCSVCFQTSCKRMNIVLPGLSCAGSVDAFIEAIESFCKFCPKLNIQIVFLSSAEDPGRENANLLMGRVMKNWKDLQCENK